MDARHNQVKRIFAAACLEPPSQRFSYLARVCGEDEATRREVEALLAFYEDGPGVATVMRRSRRNATAPKRRYRPGHVLAGRYRVERWLGAGGMSEVYAVYDSVLRQDVALKVLHRADARLRQRLVEEVRLARQVTHPGVCRVYDIGDDVGLPFLTMELIEGEDLATRLERSGPLPSVEVAHIGMRLAEALAAAHLAGVLHRDLKPANILIARNGSLYVTDFGIATSSRRTGSESGRFGTPAYMAPEEIAGEAPVTETSDLYSLGLVLYETLTGTRAFDAPDRDSLLEKQRTATPEPPSRLVRDVEPSLEALILRLLAKDATQRPPSAVAVIDALEGLISSRLEVAASGATEERRQIVSLVCRIEGPPAIMATPEWPALVHIFQARAGATCRLRGGGVHRHLTDGLAMHFGVPSASERDGEAAVRTALEIVAETEQRPLIPSERGTLTAAVTVDTAWATVKRGSVVSLERRSDRTDRSAAEVGSETTRAGAVIAGASMLALLQKRFAFVPADTTSGEHAFRVLGHRESLGLEAPDAKTTPLAGRVLETASLDRWWRDARAGRGQVVLLSGEAGIGKTRVVRELWQRIRTEGIALEARCSSFHAATPLHPFARMIANAAGLEPGDGDEARGHKLRRLLEPVGGRAEELLAIFSTWLSSPAEPSVSPSRRAVSEAGGRAFIAALSEWVLALAERQPVLLVCEDVHWSDATSREAIEELIDSIRTTRALLLLTFRPTFTPPRKRTWPNHLVVQPLAPEEALELVAAMPGRGAHDASAIVERAEGNPFFLEELVRHEQEVGTASARDDLPMTLRGLLAARLDRLGSARRIAQSAALLDRAFRYDLLAAVEATTGGTDLESGIARLFDAEILLQRGPLPRSVITWKHALLREAAYDSLPLRARRRLHAVVAGVIEQSDPDTAASRPEVIARHWTEAGRPAEAWRWWLRGGLRALDRAAYAEARYDLEQALRELRRTGLSAQQRRGSELEIHLALTATEAMDFGLGSEEAARRARRAEALCRGAAIDDRLVEAFYMLARIDIARGNLRATRRSIERLEATSERITSPFLRCAIHVQAGNYFACKGELDRAESLYATAFAAHDPSSERPTGTHDPVTHLFILRGLVAWVRGCFSHCRRHIDAGIAHADAVETQGSKAVARVNAAPVLLLAGDRGRFVEVVGDGLRHATAVKSRYLVNLARMFAPLADETLESNERMERMRSAIEDDVGVGYRLFRSLGLAELAALEAAGRPELALATFDRAVKEAATRTDRFLLPEMLRRRAGLLVSLGREEEASRDLRKGLRDARRMGAWTLALRCALSLARLLVAQRRAGQARRVLSATLAGLPADVDAPERGEAVDAMTGISTRS